MNRRIALFVLALLAVVFVLGGLWFFNHLPPKQPPATSIQKETDDIVPPPDLDEEAEILPEDAFPPPSD